MFLSEFYEISENILLKFITGHLQCVQIIFYNFEHIKETFTHIKQNTPSGVLEALQITVHGREGGQVTPTEALQIAKHGRAGGQVTPIEILQIAVNGRAGG